MKATIVYPHCVRYTPGKLDRYPHSDYERREIAVEIRIAPDTGYDCYSETGILLGWGDEPEDALKDARYELMYQSRQSAFTKENS